MKNPIPDTSTARRWNLLSDASSSAAIRSLDRVSVTASPLTGSCRLAGLCSRTRRRLAAPRPAPEKLRGTDNVTAT